MRGVVSAGDSRFCFCGRQKPGSAVVRDYVSMNLRFFSALSAVKQDRGMHEKACGAPGTRYATVA